MTIEVYRTPRRTPLQSSGKIGEAAIRVEYGNLALCFGEPRGFGDSDYDVKIRPQSFADVARAMMHADPEWAMRAFGAALQEGTPEPKEVWVPAA